MVCASSEVSRRARPDGLLGRPQREPAKAEWRIREAAGQGAQVVCLPELFRSQYFCRDEDAALFDLAEPIPGPTTETPGAARRASWHGGRRLGLRAARGGRLPQHRRRHRRRRRAAGARIARCTSPTTRSTTRSIYFTPGDLGLPRLRHALRPRRRRWSAGTSGIPEAARLTALERARRCSSTPRPSAGTRPRRPSSARPSTTPGARSSARTPSPTASTWRRSTGSATKGRPNGGLEFWGGSFVADPFGRVLAEACHDREEILVAECDPAPHGRGPPQLAVPPRPPHRRLRRHREARDRLDRSAGASRNGEMTTVLSKIRVLVPSLENFGR